MRIGFDAKRAFFNATGLGNYSRNMIRAVITAYPQHEYLLFSPKLPEGEFYREISAFPNVRIITPNGLWASFPALWRSRGITNAIIAAKADVYHGLSNELPVNIRRATATKSVVTIHDLIIFKDVSFHNIFDIFSYRKKIRRAARNADGIIAISKQTKSDLEQLLAIPGKKITVVYQPVNPEFFNVPPAEKLKAVKEKYQLPEKFMLNVGRVELRKNLHTLLIALDAIKDRTELHLVSVGRKTKFHHSLQSFVTNFGLSGRVRFIEHVDKDDLVAVYHLAAMNVYPSLMEGFGLPVAESLAAGIPVITTKGGCFEEAGGNAAWYIDPTSAASVAEMILHVESNPVAAAQKIAAGRLHIRRFDPAGLGQELMQLYMTGISGITG